MKRFAWLIVLPFALLSFAAAESLFVDMSFTQCCGGEDLIYRFNGNGPNFAIGLGGLADAQPLSDFAFPPGSYLVPIVRIFDFENPGGVLRFDGQTYDTSRGDVIYLEGLDLYRIVGFGFFFPLGGDTFSTFTKTVDAHFSPGVINGKACTASSELLDCTGFGIPVPDAKLTLSFSYNPDVNVYFFEHGEYSNVPVPEPASAGLMATGLAGILAIIRRRCSS